MLWNLILLGIVIGSNNLAVALALGAHGQAQRRRRIAAVFGVFEFFVPLAGVWLGSTISHRIGGAASVIGPTLMILLGMWTVLSGMRGGELAEEVAHRVTTWRGLIPLAAGLSLDNLIIGFSLGLGEATPLLVAATIATFSVAFTLLGLTLGAASRRHWENRAKILAGSLLVGMGLASALGWL